MIRAVLAVALAAALVGFALPVVDEARRDRADRLVRSEVATIERAADSLLAADETTPGAGARRVLSVSLPEASWTVAGVDYLAIHGGPDNPEGGPGISYAVGGRTRRIAVDALLYAPDGPVRIAGGGERRVVLELVRIDGRPAIAVRSGAPDGRAERPLLPGFMPEAGTRRDHVHPRSYRRGVAWVRLSV